MADKPVLHLIGSHDGLPTLEEIFALAEKLTGRPPTPEERAEVQARYDTRQTTP